MKSLYRPIALPYEPMTRCQVPSSQWREHLVAGDWLSGSLTLGITASWVSMLCVLSVINNGFGYGHIPVGSGVTSSGLFLATRLCFVEITRQAWLGSLQDKSLQLVKRTRRVGVMEGMTCLELN